MSRNGVTGVDRSCSVLVGGVPLSKSSVDVYVFVRCAPSDVEDPRSISFLSQTHHRLF